MKFYLGTHKPAFIGRTEVPLFVSHRALAPYKTYHRATGPWALDSGGFTELSTYGEWRTSPEEYVAAIENYTRQIGEPDWVAPQDSMCEPMILAKTGLRVEDHQISTIENFLKLRALNPPAHVIPVLQGWELIDYLRHVRMYLEAGVALHDEELVGVGTVCRRQGTKEARKIFKALYAMKIKTHGFGIKVTGLREYGHLLASADSMSWSYAARRRQLKLPECSHPRCNNCLKWALKWREQEVGFLD